MDWQDFDNHPTSAQDRLYNGFWQQKYYHLQYPQMCSECPNYVPRTLPLHYHQNQISTNFSTTTTLQPILPPKPHHNHNNHHYHTTTNILKPHCKQGSNVRTSIFLLCPLKDSGAFILALRPTTTTAAKTHSRYPP